LSEHGKKGIGVLSDAVLNKSTAFTEEEREALQLRGLLPSHIDTQETQITRVLENLRRKSNNIDRYIFLSALQRSNERLFYRTVIDFIEEVMPIIYTPTVGEACREFAHIFREPRGFYITPEDNGRIGSILQNWPEREVRVIVVTDGERILGLGDLGANGMGIPIGKLSLYVACGGIDPSVCMPVVLDVGTNNTELLNDPLYLGRNAPRLTGNPYFELVEEFVMAVQDIFPGALIQFEDFLTPNAIRLLSEYRDRVLCFNDDIQGTAAVALGGVYASTRITGIEFADLRILFLGAGSAATGIGFLMAEALREEGLSETEALRRLWFVDSSGLVVESRDDLDEHKRPYAHPHPPTGILGAIESVKPHVLIGATGSPGSFTREVLSLMARINERPLIFALSNPTSRSECTAQEAYEWTEGRAVFASGSPFGPVIYKGAEFRPGQGNNAYIFPGVGLGLICSGATRVTDEIFLAAARALARQVRPEDLDAGALYPPLKYIRDVSLSIAVAVAEVAYTQNLATLPRPEDLEGFIKEQMYEPRY